MRLAPAALLLLPALLTLGAPARSAEPAFDEEAGLDALPEPKPVSIRPKPRGPDGTEGLGSLLAPDVDVIDAPTTAVLDYGGYSARTRFFSNGGALQYISFGVFQGLNLGASLTVDGLVGDNETVRVRAPNVQVKWRFYEGDRTFPSLALGFDGQGWLYNQPSKRYNQRKRGFFIVASQEFLVPGLFFHPSMNISDFDTNHFFGSLPLTLNIRDRIGVLAEWDNINDFRDSRFNAGLRVYMTPKFHLDFAIRGIGEGGHYGDGTSRGPERIVQFKYSGNF